MELGEQICFIVSEQHLKLLKRLNFMYDESCEFGAPAVDPKRPYGNGDVYGDMRKILGIGKQAYPEQELLLLHQQMTTVLRILAQNNGVHIGEYAANRYERVWTQVR